MSQINTDAEKNPRQLEREVDEQRNELQDTLTALIERFSPNRLLENALDYTRGSGGNELSRNLVDTIRSNPLPTLLTATGLVWLIMGQSRGRVSERQPSYSESEPSHASYGVDPAYDPFAGEGHHELGSNGPSKLRRGSESIREAARSTGDSGTGLDSLFREQPLAMGVMGLALGALLGASVPRSRREDELFGEHKERLAEQAREYAERATAKAGEASQRVTDDMKRRVDTPKTRH